MMNKGRKASPVVVRSKGHSAEAASKRSSTLIVSFFVHAWLDRKSIVDIFLNSRAYIHSKSY